MREIPVINHIYNVQIEYESVNDQTMILSFHSCVSILVYLTQILKRFTGRRYPQFCFVRGILMTVTYSEVNSDIEGIAFLSDLFQYSVPCNRNLNCYLTHNSKNKQCEKTCEAGLRGD